LEDEAQAHSTVAAAGPAQSAVLEAGASESGADERAHRQTVGATRGLRSRTAEERVTLLQAYLRGRRQRMIAAATHAELLKPKRPILTLALDELSAIRLTHRAQIRSLALASGNDEDQVLAAASSVALPGARVSPTSYAGWIRMYASEEAPLSWNAINRRIIT
jgi:hypothetical protein